MLNQVGYAVFFGVSLVTGWTCPHNGQHSWEVDLRSLMQVSQEPYRKQHANDVWAALGAPWFLALYAALGTRVRDNIEQKSLSLWRHLFHIHSGTVQDTAACAAPPAALPPRQTGESPFRVASPSNAVPILQTLEVCAWPIATVIVVVLIRGEVRGLVQAILNVRTSTSRSRR